MYIIFNQFFENEVLHKSLTYFFVTLIPKVDGHLDLGNIRLISLFESLYKLALNVLEARLGKVISKLVSLDK